MSCTGKPLPKMFVSGEIDHAFIGNFMKKKYPALCQCLGKPDTMSIYCSIEDFRTLVGNITGRPGAARMKAYFASFVGSSGIFDTIPASYFGTTTLVFAPVDGREIDIENYYIIHPLGGIVEIEKTVAHEMVTYFQNKRATVLEAIAKCAGRPTTFKESKAVWYELEKLTDAPGGWLDEMNCQGANGVTICFSAYPVGATYRANNIPIGWQLTLIFLLTKVCKVNGKDYYYSFDLEDMADFQQRKDITEPPAGGGDTANPCPPATGCTPSIGNPNS